jgi:2-oxoisovalerate dehydrogenase E1 component
MLNLALRGSDPVIFFESQLLYDRGEQFEKGGVPKDYYEIPEGEPVIRKQGKDITIATIGATLYTALKAADTLKEKYGLDAEIMDLRFINPLNYEKIIESVKKTGHIILASDAVERGSFLHTVASNITQLAFDYLDAPPAVVGSRNWITPAPECEEYFFPQAEWLIDAIHERILPLKGHAPSTAHGNLETMRKNRLGV